MADFTALKTAIQTYIKQNGNEEITGNILQEVLLSVVTTLGDGAINDLVTALANEVAARQNADVTLQQNITNEATARGNADTALQGLIDGITGNIENGYVYAGIATPSSTPATGKVFYLALTAGTYTNFGSTEVSQGINILKYNGSAWSLDAFIGIDDTPTPNSPRLVKSGGTFDSIMTDGSAFDISAHFASGGTLATYADLDAALAALNTLSASYKRGGMSIKFVQSSDNKYVQYRLIAQTFTTDETQWQKSGAEVSVSQITQTEHFRISIGGSNYDVAGAVEADKLKKSIVGTTVNCDFVGWTNQSIQATLLITPSDNYLLSPPIKVEEGDSIVIKTGGASPLWTLVECEQDGTITRGLISLSGDTSSLTEYTYIVSPNEKYIRICVRVAPSGYSVQINYLGLKNELEGVENCLAYNIIPYYINNNICTLQQGTIGIIGTNADFSTRIRTSKAVSSFDGYISVPEPFVIYRIVYYSSWESDENFTFGSYDDIRSRSCKVNKQYPLMRLVISYKDITQDITPDIFYKSLGVKKFDLECNQSVLGTQIKWNPGALILTSGVRQNTDSYCISEPIQVTKGDEIVINTGGANFAIISKCNSEGTISATLLQASPNAASDTNTRYKYVVTETTYVILCYKYKLRGAFCGINGIISKANILIGEDSKVGVSSWSQYNIQENLTTIENTKYRLSPPIYMRSGEILEINSSGSAPLWTVVNSNENGDIISGVYQFDGNQDVNKTYTYIAEEDRYIRVSIRTSIEGYYIKKIKPSQFNELDRKVTALAGQKHLRILLLGNSYMSDAWGYVPFILKKYGVTCEIYMYWRGALSLDDLVRFWESSDNYDETSPHASDGAYRNLYYIDTRYQKSWETLQRKSAKDLVEMGGWDIITLLQFSAYTIDNSYTNPYFEQVVELIRASFNQPYTLGWQMSWTRPTYNGVSVDNKQDNIDVAQLINKQHCANIVFPCATAIFNCRENSTLAQIGDSTYHNLWASDNVHLEEGLPCYIAGLAIVQSIFNKYSLGYSVLGDTTRPNNDNIAIWNNPQRQMPTSGTITSVTETNCYLAQKAAIIANKYPYEINGV